MKNLTSNEQLLLDNIIFVKDLIQAKINGFEKGIEILGDDITEEVKSKAEFAIYELKDLKRHVENIIPLKD
jgi:hypothetical protein